MTKLKLLHQLNQTFPDMSLRQVEKTIDIIFGEIVKALSKGYRVELRRFGVFSVRYRDRRMGETQEREKKLTLKENLFLSLRLEKDYATVSMLYMKNKYHPYSLLYSILIHVKKPLRSTLSMGSSITFRAFQILSLNRMELLFVPFSSLPT